MLYVIALAIVIIVIAYIIRGFQESEEEGTSTNDEAEEKELKISFSPHAVQRMNERNIKAERVYSLLDSENLKTSITNCNRIKVSDSELTAVVLIKGEFLEIITVFWSNEDNEEQC